MASLGICHLASMVYLTVVVSLVVSLNESDSWPRIARETARRSAKLLGGLAVVILLIAGLGLLG